MREIKFRAWDKTTNRMREVLGVLFHSKLVGLREDKENMFYANLFEVELMQYTHLKDKNGKEIYEGDIVRRKWFRGEEIKYVTEIIQFDIGAFWCVRVGGCGGELLGRHLTTVTPSEIEVIGNIYEDKHLLEVKHE